MCVFDALTMGGLWSYCVAVLSQSQWGCQSSSGWKTLSFLASCSNCLLRGLFCSVPVLLPPLACVSIGSCWQANTKAVDSFLDTQGLEISCNPLLLPPSILQLIYPTSISLSFLGLSSSNQRGTNKSCGFSGKECILWATCIWATDV